MFVVTRATVGVLALSAYATVQVRMPRVAPAVLFLLVALVGKTAAFSALAAGRPPTALEVLEAVARLATAEELGVDEGFSSGTGCG